MSALVNLFGSATSWFMPWFSALSPSAIWSKVKLALLVGSIAFMFWQGWQMTSLKSDVTRLETVQTSLQAQVQQISVDYSVLRDNYKNTAKTSEQYYESVRALGGKSVELEKSFAELELHAAMFGNKTLKKPTTALATATGATTGVNNETSSTQALTRPVGDAGNGDADTDAQWRKLLDTTYCSVATTSDPKCP